MRVAMIVLSAIALAILIMSDCAAGSFYAGGPGADGLIVDFVALPMAVLGLVLGLIGGIMAVVSAVRARQRHWRVVTMGGVVLGGGVPLALLAALFILVAEDASYYSHCSLDCSSPPDVRVNGVPMFDVITVLLVALPTVLPLVTLAYVTTMGRAARTLAPIPYAAYPPPVLSHPTDTSAPAVAPQPTSPLERR